MKKLLILSAICLLNAAFIFDSFGQEEIEKLCRDYPQRIDMLFSNLDLDYSGMEKVRAAWQQGDKQQACIELLEYYKNTQSGKWLRKAPVAASKDTDPLSEQILRDTFVHQGVKGVVPRNKQGGLDWNYSPNDDFQWTLFLNRHFHLTDLMNGYLATGNTNYTDRISDNLVDWVISSPYPGSGQTHSPKYKSWQWSLLEAGSRGVIWPEIFYGLYESLSDDAKILMLSSVPDHFHCLRNFHAKGGNHLAIEMRGLASLAGAFGEFKESEPILDYCAKVMSKGLFDQVYPDGVQKELTVHYHGVAFRAFYAFAEVYKNIGKPLPNEFTDHIDAMLDYIAFVQRPNGYGPLNNDSDYVYIRQNIERLNDIYNREDWAYIISNGSKGIKPDKLSVFYPWASQAVMRNGWEQGAHWSFFDVGAWGSGHRHADKLHLSISAYGKDLLVDSGRYTYVGYSGGNDYPWRDYFISSVSHNVILVDGKGQKPKVHVASQPLKDAFVATDEYDFAVGEYDEGYHGIDDKISHTRAVLYVRDKFWVVIDKVQSQKPHKIQAMWRFHPECSVEIQKQSVATNNSNRANLRITPLSQFDWGLELVKGQIEPFIQGWYSVEYNKKEANTAAVYSTDINGSKIFAWIFEAHPNNQPQMRDAEILSQSDDLVQIRIKTDSENKIDMDIPMDGGIRNLKLTKDKY